MPVKSFKAYTPSRRNMTMSDFSDITASEPLKSLTVGHGERGGRNNRGKVTAYHKGSGVSACFVSSIGSATKPESRPKLPRSNTIQTAAHALHC